MHFSISPRSAATLLLAFAAANARAAPVDSQSQTAGQREIMRRAPESSNGYGSRLHGEPIPVSRRPVESFPSRAASTPSRARLVRARMEASCQVSLRRFKAFPSRGALPMSDTKATSSCQATSDQATPTSPLPTNSSPSSAARRRIPPRGPESTSRQSCPTRAFPSQLPSCAVNSRRSLPTRMITLAMATWWLRTPGRRARTTLSSFPSSVVRSRRRLPTRMITLAMATWWLRTPGRRARTTLSSFPSSVVRSPRRTTTLLRSLSNPLLERRTATTKMARRSAASAASRVRATTDRSTSATGPPSAFPLGDTTAGPFSTSALACASPRPVRIVSPNLAQLAPSSNRLGRYSTSSTSCTIS